MYPIFISTFITLTTLLLDIRGKCIKPAYKYVVIFFLIAGINFFFSSTVVQAEQFDLFKERYLTYDTLSNQIVIVENKLKHENKSIREIKKDFMYACKAKMDYHCEEGCRCLKEAEEASFLLPNISERDKANFCFTNIMAVLAPGTPALKLIGAALAICAQYGSMVMAEWQRVDTKLHQAKYHFEMEEHYRLVGKHVQDQLNSEKFSEKK